MNKYTIITLLSFLVVALVLPAYALWEPARMEQTQADVRQDAVSDASVLYVENCAVCHGSAGEGIGANPALNSEALRTADYDVLFKTIARGLYGTAMPAWHLEEGGPLNEYQIEQLVTLVRYGDWPEVGEMAAARGLIPARLPSPEVEEALIAQITELDPAGEEWARGMQLFAGNCTVCHGVNGEGSELAVPLNTAEVRATDTAELVRLITEGVPGTLMAGWSNALAEEDIEALVAFLHNWDRLGEAGVQLVPPAPIRIDVSNPEEMQDLGEQLFTTTCVGCHGENGSGGLGPALNSQQVLTRQSDDQIRSAIVNGGNRPFSQMPAFGERLTGVEIDALVQFIRAWEPTAPSVSNPRGTAQGGGPPWLRATPDPNNPVQPGQGQGQGFGQGQGQGNGGQGRGNGNGQGQGNGNGSGGGNGNGQGGPAWRNGGNTGQQSNGAQGNAGGAGTGTVTEVTPFAGEIVLNEGNSLSFRDSAGTLVQAMLGPVWFWSENSIALNPGDRIEGEGFFSTDHMEVVWLDNLSTGASIRLRSADGIPVWSGGGQSQP